MTEPPEDPGVLQRLVVDTNVLIAEWLRARGRHRMVRLAAPLLATERVEHEFRYELQRRLGLIRGRGGLTEATAQAVERDVLELYEQRVSIVGADKYAHLEAQARARIPTDPDDWPSVALALATDADLWTEDRDFFGCGLALWRTEVLYAELDRLGP